MKKTFSLLLLPLLLLYSCSSVKRFASASYQGEDHELADIHLYGYHLHDAGPADPGQHLWDLSATAQTALIKVLDRRYPANSDFLSALNQRYPDKALSGMDYLNKQLDLVFSISRKRNFSALNQPALHFSPADRIAWLSFKLEIPASYPLHFLQWDHFATEYGNLDIADVGFSRSIDLSAKAPINDLVSAEARGKFSRDERQALQAQYLRLNGSLSDKQLRLEQEGTREIDLSGNVTTSVSMAFDGVSTSLVMPVYQDIAGSPGTGESIKAIRLVPVLVPAMESVPDTLKGILSMDYVYRHVQKGWPTFAEWDDEVEFYSGRVEKEVLLFTRSEIVPVFAGIRAGDEAFFLGGPGNESRPLQFTDYAAADRFLSALRSMWLSGSRKAICFPGEQYLYLGRKKLTFEYLESLEAESYLLYY